MASKARSGRSLTREFGRGRGMVYAWTFSAMCVSTGYRQRWRGNASEREHVLRLDDFRLVDDRIAEGDVDAEGLPVELPSELAGRPEAEAVVDHAGVLDLRVVVVRHDLEGHEVPEIEPAAALETREQASGVPIMRRSTSLVVRGPGRP